MKVDLSKLQFTPELEWLAIHKKTGEKLFFDFADLVNVGPNNRIAEEDFHEPYAFTGYYDVDDKIYGGQLLRTRYRNKPAYGVVFSTGTSWCIRPISDNWRGDRSLSTIYSKEIIGHIHIKPWPEEVRRLLE